jgi:hypothetical protein
MFTHLSNSSHGMPTTSRDMVNVFDMGPIIAEGPTCQWECRRGDDVFGRIRLRLGKAAKQQGVSANRPVERHVLLGQT